MASAAQEVVAAAVEAFNFHDASRIRATYVDDAVLEAPGDVRRVGPDASTEFLMGWVNAFPDGLWTVNNEVASGDWVVDQITFEGTHEAPLPGPDGEIPVTHRRIAIRGVEVFRIVGDKIAEDHIYYDQVQFLEQLGVRPVAAEASA